MQRLLIVVCCILYGCASADNKLPNNGQVTVNCVGSTFEDTKTKCFVDAIEIVLGKIILTETKVQNLKLTKEEIIKHSAGYVDEFIITNKIIEPSRVSMTMNVKVRSSKLAERVLGVHNPEGPINGPRMLAQYQTYLDDRKTGDLLAMKVVLDYPNYAYTIKKYPVEFKLDRDRNALIIVPFELKWNYNYLKALNEALSIVQDGKGNEIQQEVIAIQSKDPKAWILGETKSYYFNDGIRANKIKESFTGFISVHATLADDSGRTIFSGCKDMTVHGINVTNPMIIRGNEEYGDTISIKVDKNNPKYRELDNANNISFSYKEGRCY